MHPQSCLLVLGDFNSFPDGYLISSLNLTKIVKVAIGNNRILDKCYTNIANFYEKPTILPYLENSDHHPVLLRRSNAPRHNKGQQCVKMKRVTSRNGKAMFVHSLQQVNWTPLYRLSTYVRRAIHTF